MKTFTTKTILTVAVLFTFTFLNPSPCVACECIVSGETKSATIQFGGETHCYWFWGESGQGVEIEIADNSSTHALDPRVQLYDPNGVRIADSGWQWLPWDGATIENCQLKMTGIYTIVASDGYVAGGDLVGTGEYGLSLVSAPGVTTCLQDHDGGDMTIGRTQSGTITPGGDLDAYTFYGQAGQGVVIEMVDMSASKALDPRVQLYDPNGVQVADSGWRWLPWDSAAIENYQLEMTGIYTIVVSDGYVAGGDSVGTGEYGLSVSVMPPNNPYGLYPYHPLPPDGNSVSLCDWDTLSWWPVDGATGYDVYFAGSPCMPLEKVAENIQDPYLPIPVVEQEQVCYWMVVARTPAGDIRGPVWWFATEPYTCCALTISAIGQGAIVDPNAGFREYPCGEVVPVTAVADPDYEFVRWEGSAVDANKTVIEYQNPTGSKIWVTVDGAYTLRAVFEEVLFDFPLDIDPGWTGNGQWEFGMPTGQGGEEYGNPDPTGGYTGPNVFGVNLDGDYDVDVGPRYSLLAGPFGLRGYSDVNLRFARWLNIDEPRYVKASLDVSVIGENWRTLWESETEITDSQWVLVKYVLGDETEGQSAVYLRWTYQVVGERAYPCSGWNLDDIQLCGKRQ
jgi:hypothetical protein